MMSVPSGLLRRGLLLASVVLLSSGCDRSPESRTPTRAEETAAAEDASEDTSGEESPEGRAAERRAKGDTLALPYQELAAYLPATLAGYQAQGEVQGSTVSVPGTSYSTCSRNYTKGPADNQQTLSIVLADYNGAAAMFTGSSAVFGQGVRVDTNEELMESVDLGTSDVKAIEIYHKKDHRAAVMAGVAERFFVTAEATRQADAKLVGEAVKQLDLQRLAKR